MTFAALHPHDYNGIARAERARRQAAALRARWDADRRAADDADWRAIAGYEFEWVEVRAAHDRPDTPARARRDHLAAVALKVALTAIRKWHAEGRPRGEAEARAFKLFALARRLARCAGHPIPMIDAEGQLVAADRPQEKAA